MGWGLFFIFYHYNIFLSLAYLHYEKVNMETLSSSFSL